MMRTENSRAAVFLGLVLDADLVRAEFEALMAAEFPQLPRSRPDVVVGVPGPWPAGRFVGRMNERPLPDRKFAPDSPARERAPPHAERMSRGSGRSRCGT